jgi:hypothetical protein
MKRRAQPFLRHPKALAQNLAQTVLLKDGSDKARQ